MDKNKVTSWLKPLSGMFLFTVFSSSSLAVMSPLDDQSLSNETGQALFYTDYVAPGATNSPIVNSGIGFFTLGLNASIELNANISRLQLGCGGVNGPGACDIDIQDMSLVGLTPVNGSYAGTNFLLSDPFLMLAIKNPTSLSTRELVGVNFGARSALGSLLTGQNNITAVNQPITATNNPGINTLSGSLGVYLEGAVMPNVCVAIAGSCLGPNLVATAAPHAQVVTLNRSTQVDDLGPLTATSPIGPFTLTLNNIHLVNAPLRLIHEIKVSTPDGKATPNLSVSLQSQPVAYPFIGANGVQTFTYLDAVNQRKPLANQVLSPVPTANTGWWMNLPLVTIKQVTSEDQIEIPVLAGVGNILFNGRINLPPVDFGQKPLSNCYGGLKFC